MATPVDPIVEGDPIEDEDFVLRRVGKAHLPENVDRNRPKSPLLDQETVAAWPGYWVAACVGDLRDHGLVVEWQHDEAVVRHGSITGWPQKRSEHQKKRRIVMACFTWIGEEPPIPPPPGYR